MKITHTLLTAALATCVAAPALAQTVDVRVKVDTRIAREVAEEIRGAAMEVREAMRSTFGPELQRELRGAARELADVFDGFGDFNWDDAFWGQSQRYRAVQTDRETRRFSTGASGQLDLDTISGDITVRPTSGREIVVEIVRESRGATEADARAGLSQVTVDSEERAGRVTVKARYPRGRNNFSVNVSYIVEAPAGTKLSTHSISGDVTVTGITGEVSINTTSGDVEITGATHLNSAKTVSGDVTLRDVSAQGLLEASTVSGDMVVTGAKARRLDLSTISGEVTARGIEADDVTLKSMSGDAVFDGPLTARGNYEFVSHSGNVRIAIAGQTGFALEAESFSGSVRSDFPIAVTTIRSRRTPTRSIKGTFGDGSAAISATSFSGNVVITKR